MLSLLKPRMVSPQTTHGLSSNHAWSLLKPRMISPQTTHGLALLVPSQPLPVPSHSRTMLHSMASVAVACPCRRPDRVPERVCVHQQRPASPQTTHGLSPQTTHDLVEDMEPCPRDVEMGRGEARAVSAPSPARHWPRGGRAQRYREGMIAEWREVR
jgi:hypothetical protein